LPVSACGQPAPNCVASRTPDQDDAGCGGRHRNFPVGGAAYGSPLKDDTPAALAPRMRPPSTRTTGLVPPDAGDATALPVPAVMTVAATPTADTANNAARRTRRVRVVFMLSPLPGPVGTVFGLVLRFGNCGTPRASSRYWYGHWSTARTCEAPGRRRLTRVLARVSAGSLPGARGNTWPGIRMDRLTSCRRGARAPRGPLLETSVEVAGQCPVPWNLSDVGWALVAIGGSPVMKHVTSTPGPGSGPGFPKGATARPQGRW